MRMGTLGGDLVALWIAAIILFVLVAVAAGMTPDMSTIGEWVWSIVLISIALGAILVTILQLVGIIGVW